jgi:hypothetical protein
LKGIGIGKKAQRKRREAQWKKGKEREKRKSEKVKGS